MRSKIRDNTQEINSGSMADIGFLLLIFFLVATTLVNHKGLNLQLPPEIKEPVRIKDKNVFKILINSENRILIEGEVFSGFENLRERAKLFVLNNGEHEDLSESPEKAIFSIKTSRKTKYKTFIAVLDEIKGVYYEIYGSRVGLSEEQYRALRYSNETERLTYEKGKMGIPMNISLAEPNK